MQPTNPFNDESTGIDYLNQIAAPPPAQGFDRKTKIIMAILALVGVLSLLFIFFMASKTTNTTNPSQLAARVQNLLTVSQKYNKKLQNSKLQSTNSSLISVLTSANASIAEPLKAYDIDLTKQKKEIAALESTTDLEKKLDEAYLNAQLDLIYAHEINIQLADTVNMMKKLLSSTNKSTMKQFLEKTIADLQGIQKQLKEVLASS